MASLLLLRFNVLVQDMLVLTKAFNLDALTTDVFGSMLKLPLFLAISACRLSYVLPRDV
jgi:hypothetical protein